MELADVGTDLAALPGLAETVLRVGMTASDIPAAPTPEQQAQFQALFDALDPDLQADLRALGEPSTFLLWSTS